MHRAVASQRGQCNNPRKNRAWPARRIGCSARLLHAMPLALGKKCDLRGARCVALAAAACCSARLLHALQQCQQQKNMVTCEGRPGRLGAPQSSSLGDRRPAAHDETLLRGRDSGTHGASSGRL